MNGSSYFVKLSFLCRFWDEKKEGVPPEFQVIFIFLFSFVLFLSVVVGFFSHTRNPFRIILHCNCTTSVSLLSISTHTQYCNISKDFMLTIIFLDSFVQCEGSHVAR